MKNVNQKCIIGRSWSINEQLELLKLIKGEKPFVEYVGAEHPKIESIKDNLLFLRRIFNQIDAFVVEVSSLRYYLGKDNKLIHNIKHHDIKHGKTNFSKKDMSSEEFEITIKDFIEYSKKPIFFVSHFDRKRKPYREVIWENLKKVSTEHENIFLIDTSLMPNLQTNKDGEHYAKAGHDNAMKYIGDVISQTLYRILQ